MVNYMLPEHVMFHWKKIKSNAIEKQPLSWHWCNCNLPNCINYQLKETNISILKLIMLKTQVLVMYKIDEFYDISQSHWTKTQLKAFVS